MNRTPFNLQNLGKLDYGKIAAAFEAEVKRVVEDLDDRPHDGKPRTVVIKFGFQPRTDKTAATATLEGVDVEAEVSSTVPKRRTRIYQMDAKHDGTLFFHPEMPEDADGDLLTDDDVLERERSAKR